MLRYIVFSLFFSLSLQAQDFDTVAQKVDAYTEINSAEALAQQIQKDFTSEEDKVKATFYWLAKNIRYNLREFYNPKQRSYRFSYADEAERLQKIQEIKDKLVAKAFKTKLGVCEEYAQSLKKVCDLLGIEAHVITGYVRIQTSDIGVIPSTTNHAWNAVKLNNRYVILDATWAAGYEFENRWIRDFNTYYYDMPTDAVFKTHYPKDRLWILRLGRMDIDEFYNQPIYANGFLKSGATLISPKNGILNSRADSITIELKDLPATINVAYFIPGMRHAERPKLIRKDGITSFQAVNLKRESELVIYFNQRDALYFRLE